MMFDNHRLLHGRTSYDSNEGLRHLQGCYLDFDSTNGKLRHLKKKFLYKPCLSLLFFYFHIFFF